MRGDACLVFGSGRQSRDVRSLEARGTVAATGSSVTWVELPVYREKDCD